MRIFNELKGDNYDALIKEYEHYLPEYFSRLEDAEQEYPEALENDEYKSYIYYDKWPIRKLEYSFVISQMKKSVQKGDRVLEAGCGVSPMPFLWAEFGGNVTAVDFDPKSINLMRKFSEKDFFGTDKKIELQVCDIMDLPYPDESFDIVTTTSVLEHLPYPNYLLAISELYRVLKPSGTLVCTCDIKAGDSPKRDAVGAFSVNDIKAVLSCFEGELVDEDISSENLQITEDQIERFWLDHYYEGIGYKGNREYVAVGFTVNKKNTENKQHVLLKYEDMIRELMVYQKKVDDKEEEIRKLKDYMLRIEEDRKDRLQIIDKLTKDSEQRLDQLEQVNREAEERRCLIEKLDKENHSQLKQIDKLTARLADEKNNVESLKGEADLHLKQIEQLSGEAEKRKEVIERLSEESELRLKYMEELAKQTEERKQVIDAQQEIIAEKDRVIKELQNMVEKDENGEE